MAVVNSNIGRLRTCRDILDTYYGNLDAGNPNRIRVRNAYRRIRRRVRIARGEQMTPIRDVI